MRIIVTGAAGFIGSHTVDALLAEGHTVVGIDNFRTGQRVNLKQALEHERFTLHEMDVTDVAQLHAVLQVANCDAVIHLAALVSVPESFEKPEENFRLNVYATHCVAEAARRFGVKRIVFASSAAVYGNDSAEPVAEDAPCAPRSPYGTAKLASEVLLLGFARSTGVVVRCQRYFNVYGPRQDPRSPYSGVISIFAERLQAQKDLHIFGDGKQTRDFIAVRDVARANVIAATRPGLMPGIANICTGKLASLNDMVATLGLIRELTPRVTFDHPRIGDIHDSVGEPRRAGVELGFFAEVSLEVGLREYLGSLSQGASGANGLLV